MTYIGKVGELVLPRTCHDLSALKLEYAKSYFLLAIHKILDLSTQNKYIK
jgi:hypothetical protein